jgi:glycosyltransferase involved in cell wall biosynthesis
VKDRRVPRIGIVAASLDILGGHGVQALALAEGLAGEGFEVRLIPINPRFPAGLRWLRRAPGLRTLFNQSLYWPSLLRLGDVDTVHVFAASYWSFLLGPVPAMLAARAFGKRVVLHYHSGEAGDHLARFGPLVHPWLRMADALVVPSEYLRRVFAGHDHAARVIPNVVDTSRFRFRERAPLRPRLLSARSLEPHYAVENNLRAYALLKRRHPEATLTVAGDGSQQDRLRRFGATLGAGVRFVGGVAPARMADLLDGSDVFVNSSLIDNQPVSILEAFAAGVSVVTTGTGDIANMVRHEENGLIVPPQDPAALADAVSSLLAQPERAACMARRARAEVERYTWPRVREAWAEVYGSTTGARKVGGAAA